MRPPSWLTFAPALVDLVRDLFAENGVRRSRRSEPPPLAAEIGHYP